MPGPEQGRLPDQAGYLLIEMLVSVLIFSIGLLGIVAMYATSIRNNTEAKYRADASFLVNELIGKMRTDARQPAVLEANWEGDAGSGGASYLQWLQSLTPGDDPAKDRLPGIRDRDENKPTIVVNVIDGFTPPDTAKSLVTITLRWQITSTDPLHHHVVTTVIK